MSAQDYMYIIEYNHCVHPTTWGLCSNGCCRGARGSGLCVECAEEELGKLIGVEPATAFTEGVKALHNTKCYIQNLLEQKEY